MWQFEQGGKIVVVTRQLSRVVNHSIFVTTRVKYGSYVLLIGMNLHTSAI